MFRHPLYRFAAPVALASLLAIGAGAQTQSAGSSSNSKSQPQATQAATQPAENTATGKPPLTPPIRQGFWGRLNPFARKKYVQGQLQPIRDRANELDGLTADNSKSISDLDARAKAGIAAAGDRAKQAADTADAANQQVQQDTQQAGQLDDRVSSVNSKLESVDQYQVAQSADLHFRPGPAKLSADTQQQLNTFLNGLADQKGYVVEVMAYSTRKGAAGITASQSLADTVVRYMVLQQNIPLYRIYTMGLGDAAPQNAQMASNGSGARSTRGGTVQIKILKNSLASNNSPQ